MYLTAGLGASLTSRVKKAELIAMLTENDKGSGSSSEATTASKARIQPCRFAIH